MMLPALILVLFGGGALAFAAGRAGAAFSRWVAVFAIAADMALLALAWTGALPAGGPVHAMWLAEYSVPWIARFGISLHLAADGLAFLMVALTLFTGLAAIAASWTEITERAGFFHFNIMVTLAGITGVFLSADLFLFYFFWEVMLVPMYLLIGIWGHENRNYATLKFFLFTQGGGLLMFLAILGLYFIHGNATGEWTFDYNALLGTVLEPGTARLLALGFMAAFLVKLPAIPLHTWLPDAHTQAPTAGSVILAGLLLKTGAYGLLRFVLPLFPTAAVELAPYAMIVGAAGILYGAKLAFAQTDLKRLVAYTSVNHMGFILVGIFSLNEAGLQGSVMQILCHALSTGALFILAGALKERLHTRELDKMGGLWAAAPRMGVAGMIFALASLGMPGMGNFIAEFLILAGAWAVSPWVAAAAALGLVLSAAYSLRVVQRVFHGPLAVAGPVRDFGVRESGIMAALFAAIMALGLYPGPVLDVTKGYVMGLIAGKTRAVETLNQSAHDMNTAPETREGKGGTER
ncbi:MAG: NADH-quinone oxidoreductase subunit M [Spirochaetes bacterium]|nr:MAG: NADH-quinone oxidoreductase subunit M [Spirochaetota bacterium]